jgi:Mg2+ and Co2+ transporter CorA
MARDTSFDERRKQRELEDEDDRARQEARKSGNSPGKALARTGDAHTDKLLELFQRAEPLIDQLNSLYNQYVAGIEQRPPHERRKQLDELMATLQTMNKPTPAYQFRFTTLNASYLTHRDRWDRLIKDLESGKIKRVTGPRRAG